MKKKGTLHTRLLMYYGCLITIIMFIIFYSFYFYIADSLEEQASSSLTMISSTVSARMDDLIEQMSSNSTKILYSSRLKELINSHSLYGQNMDSLSAQRAFNEAFFAIMGPQLPVSQVNIFREDGHYISAGNYTAFGNTSDNLKETDWFSKALEKNGAFFISPPHLNEWSYYHLPVLSLYRSFSPQFGKKDNAVIEMQLDYASLETVMNNMSIATQFFILDENGTFIYPAEDTAKELPFSSIRSYWESINTSQDTGTFTALDSDTKLKKIISYTHSPYTNFSVIVLEDEYTLFAPVRDFRNNLFMIGLLSLLVTLMVSYLIAQKVTVPIRRLYTSIKNLNLDTLGEHQDETLHSSLNELEVLNHSFLEMKDRLEQSLEETISSKSHEIQAKMLALQSQMNPHFLYNTLTTISIMAENGGNTDITEVCDSLSSMLRYISGDEPGLVTLQEEAEHTKNFLNLIKIRYGENLYYDIKIPDEMYHIRIPKMVVEPLVENCVKYAMNGLPPWHLTVTGVTTEDSWQISVRDTGTGFSPDRLAELLNTFSHLDPQKEIPTLKLNGMGLINIFIRLKLTYQDRAVFSIQNLPEGGACVTIGGVLNPERV